MKIELGQVVGIWGVKGWIKLHSYTRQRADIGQYSNWWLQVSKKTAKQPEKLIKYKVLECRKQGKNIVALLDGVDNTDKAQALNGQSILIAEADLPELPSGEYYWQQLIGLSVSNTKQIEFGIIDSIIETGANDVLIIKEAKDKKATGDKETTEVLIPYVDSVVQEVNLVEGSMLVDWDLAYLD